MSLTTSLADFLTSSGAAISYSILFLILFAESGILLGFFLPGDTLLIAIGIAASKGILNLPLLLLVCSLGAVIGDSVGYAFGRKVGPSLFNKPDSRFFKKQNLKRAHEFSERYGVRTIVLARFVPFARTFAPILAGVGKMNYRTFLSYNVIGGVGWVCSIILIGYFAGRSVTDIDAWILPIIGVIVLISALPVLWEYLKHKRQKAAAAKPQ